MLGALQPFCRKDSSGCSTPLRCSQSTIQLRNSASSSPLGWVVTLVQAPTSPHNLLGLIYSGMNRTQSIRSTCVLITGPAARPVAARCVRRLSNHMRRALVAGSFELARLPPQNSRVPRQLRQHPSTKQPATQKENYGNP